MKKYRKYALGAYFLLCVIYCVIKIAIPSETTVGQGLENLGRRQIVERTAYLNEGDRITAAEKFAEALVNARRKIHFCKKCQGLTDLEVCAICDSNERDHSVICVVAEPKDVMAFERTHEFEGTYHVLHGVISPLNHITQDDIRVKELLQRVAAGGVSEVIMATNPDTEGEATAMYISRILRPMQIKVTRLAYGVPVGSQLEYADEVTLSRALEGRQEM